MEWSDSLMDHLQYRTPLEETINANQRITFFSSWGTSFQSTSYHKYPWEGCALFTELEETGNLTPQDCPVLKTRTSKTLSRCHGHKNLWMLSVDPLPDPHPHPLSIATPSSSGKHPHDGLKAHDALSFMAHDALSFSGHMVSLSLPDDSSSQIIEEHASTSTTTHTSVVSGFAHWAPGPVCTTTLPSTTEMSPPPEYCYLTFEQAHSAASEWAINHGYKIVASSAKGRSPVFYRCYKGGLTPEQRAPGAALDQKRHSSRMVNCPFRMSIRKRDGGWGVRIDTPQHENHEVNRLLPVTQAASLTKAEQIKVLEERERNPNTAPVHIRKALNEERQRQGLALLGGTKQIRNLLAQKKRKAQPLHAYVAVQDCTHSKLHVRTWANEGSELVGIFLMPKQVIPLLPSVCDVLAIDATYKTSAADYCLVQMVCSFPWRSSIVVAIAIMENETREAYIWMLDQLTRLWPSESLPRLVITDNDAALRAALLFRLPEVPTLLCHWHASQNVEEKIITLLPTDTHRAAVKEWKALIEEEDQEASEVLWMQYKFRYQQVPNGDDFIAYLESGWHAERNWSKIAACHTKRYRHFGLRTTSHVESQHASLKANMPRLSLRRRQEVTTLLEQWWIWWQDQFKIAQQRLEAQKRTELWMRNETFLADVRGRVAHEALKEAYDQLVRARDTIEVAFSADPASFPCANDLSGATISSDDQDYIRPACLVWLSKGVPCCHRIQILLTRQCHSLQTFDFAPFHVLPEVIADDHATLGLPHNAPESSTLAADFANTAHELEERYQLTGLPQDHEQRMQLVKDVYVSGSGVLSNTWTSPKKKNLWRLKPKSHLKAQRILTRKESADKKARKKAKRDSTMCGTCGALGHRAPRCPNRDNEAMKRAHKEKQRKKANEDRKAFKRRRQAEESAQFFGPAAISPSPSSRPRARPYQGGDSDTDSSLGSSGIALLTAGPSAVPHRRKMAHQPMPKGVDDNEDVIGLAAQVPELVVPEVLKQEITVGEMRSLCCHRTMRKTMANGHCGFEALVIGSGRKISPCQLRSDFYNYLNSQALADFPELPKSSTIWKDCKRQLFPKARPPVGEELKVFEKHAGPEHWLSTGQLPFLAQMLQQAICICDLRDAKLWGTYLPRRITSLYLQPPIGLAYNGNHYDYIRMQANARLPPVTTEGWPPFRFYQDFIRQPSHKAIHFFYSFYVWSQALRSECGCYTVDEDSGQVHFQGRRSLPQPPSHPAETAV